MAISTPVGAQGLLVRSTRTRHYRKQRQFPYRGRNQAGFVIPTTMMVLLLLSLILSSMFIRTTARTEQIIGERDSQAVYNSATPAIERAKSKLEYLFKRDPRFSSGIPSELQLQSMMLNDGVYVEQELDSNGVATDLYTLPGEERLDLNGDGMLDNAWSFERDADGDGEKETIAYSILMLAEMDLNQDGQIDEDEDISIEFSSDEDKVANLVNRSGPLTVTTSANGQANCPIEELTPEKGWYPVNSVSVRKNFQVNAIIANNKDFNRSIATVEYHQDRQLDKGNKWGAWFRYDLENYPGPRFRWNGAIHTEGNLLLGKSTRFDVHLISSPHSCLYTEDAAEVTITQQEDLDGNIIFQGQVVAGNPSFRNSFAGGAQFDIFPGIGTTPSGGNRLAQLRKNSDSVADQYQQNGVAPSPNTFNELSLDPIALFTEDRSQSRGYGANTSVRDSNWADSDLAKRILNKVIRQPYVDDSYRADDRWGPKPNYNERIIISTATRNDPNVNQNDYDAIALGEEYGDLFADNPDYADVLDILTENEPDSEFLEQVGLDGYWERRARVEGLRAIVGTRLELGNSNGWGGSNNADARDDDPLYPANDNTLTNLERQRRTLRDNLAAVQATAIYHYDFDRDFPIATIATTAHPGTTTTRSNSTTFNNVFDSTDVETNFLEGIGTNGWEFEAPGNVASDSEFGELLVDADGVFMTDRPPLTRALENLAHFAGDTFGAFPPRQDTDDANDSNDAVPSFGPAVHPEPILTMWGNFSNLRRAMEQFESDGYQNLSLADKSTIHTAAATLGMLGYNLQKKEEVYNAIASENGNAGMTALGQHLWQLVDGNTANGEVNDLINPAVPFPNNYDRDTDAADFYSQFTAEQYIEALSNANGLGSNQDELIEKARLILSTLQIERDRILGFVDGPIPVPPGVGNINWDGATGEVTVGNGSNQVTLTTECDPDLFQDAFNSNPGAGGIEEKKIGLALAFCSGIAKPKYPSLYYLFPFYQHDHLGDNVGLNATLMGSDDDQPTDEEYIADTYIFNNSSTVIDDINHGYVYQPLLDEDADGVEDGGGIATIALLPRERVDWMLPQTQSSTDPTINQNQISDRGTTVYVAFQDKGFFDGRQLMQVRALDLDLNLLRSTTVPNSDNGDLWLPKSGIIYGFREDAVREDAIARPATQEWDSCDTDEELTGANCRMNLNISPPQDPPVNPDTGISPKPIDYYGDPDRRPYGFRLKNGIDISRDNSNNGLSFISDNPIYLQGDFNLHSTDGSNSNLIEEFTNHLNTNWSDFYTRNQLDTRFARVATDHWRPSEILGDAVSTLSKNFCDGTMEDGMRENSNSCPSGRKSSYLNSTLADSGQTTWTRENPEFNGDSLESPIRVDRNGQFYRDNGNLYTNYRNINTNRDLNNAVETRINTVWISGLVPSRHYQSYGGLHNFPRFLETWSGDPLWISGSFVQLNFSTYGTGPFDQDAWEPNQNPVAQQDFKFYSPPQRRWGYDVALQYRPPSPIVERFISVGSPRNEFYQEVSADDPYSNLLFCAFKDGKPNHCIPIYATNNNEQ